MKIKKTISYACYRVIRFFVWLFYPKMRLYGLQQLPDEPCIIVANHCQMNGPIASELYFPGKRSIWCAGQMMQPKEVAEYAFSDFWSQKPRWTHPFYKLLSHLIVPLSVCVFRNAHTIAVYRDSRVVGTFKNTVRRLESGDNVIIFPEHDEPHNHIVYDFQDKFIDIARLYFKKTGKRLSFVPMYIAPSLHQMHIGTPIQFDPADSMQQQRQKISGCLMDSITALARSLPEHTVVPYRNIPRKYYPKNRP